MNILFLSLPDIKNINERGLYQDLIREFIKNGHCVHVVSAVERRKGEKTNLIEEHNYKLLRVKTGNIQKSSFIEKGISTMLVGHQFLNAIIKFFPNIIFDLIIYPTPPITFGATVSNIKKSSNAKCYLLLKDIFPQGAVDLGVLSEKSLICKYFRAKERKLYEITDFIGCMSQANVDYVLKHNSYLHPNKVEICPNCSTVTPTEPISPSSNSFTDYKKLFSIPEEPIVFIYGGNLGRPQCIDFVIDCLKQNINRDDVYFIMCGDGTDYYLLEEFIASQKPKNVKLIKGLPRDEYDKLKSACDVGLIFLDYRFTIPNFPSRMLSYMENALPVFACTDTSSDIGQVIVDGGFGWWCESNNANNFTRTLEKIVLQKDEVKQKGQRALEYLKQNYAASISAEIILKHFTSM